MSIESCRSGILVLRRIDYFLDNRFKAVNRVPIPPWTHEEVVKVYKGIEGEPWPLRSWSGRITLSDGLSPVGQYESILNYYEEASGKYQCDMLYIQTSMKEEPVCSLPDGFAFCGYDFGFYYSEFNYYSVIFHEVIYGAQDELRRHSEYLNANLLLPNVSDVEALERVRKRMVESGSDLEVADIDEAFQGIAVFMAISSGSGNKRIAG